MYNAPTRNILYRLKREFGVFLKLQWRDSCTTNRETGNKVVKYSGIELRQAILLPESIKRNAQMGMPFPVGNKTGAWYDAGERGLILDIKDLPISIIPKMDWFVVYNNRRYEIKAIDEITDLAAYQITLKEVIGSTKSELFQPKDISNNLSLTDLVEVQQNPRVVIDSLTISGSNVIVHFPIDFTFYGDVAITVNDWSIETTLGVDNPSDITPGTSNLSLVLIMADPPVLGGSWTYVGSDEIAPASGVLS